MTLPDIEKTLLEYQKSSDSDEQFISQVNELALKVGIVVLKRLFNLLVGIDLTLDECTKHWESSLIHRQDMIGRLGRNVDLTISLADYFQQINTHLSSPRIIESKQYQEIIRKTITDKLTGLFNRRYFDEAYEQQVAVTSRYRENFTVLFLDIDNFKLINDRFGHRAGDQVLQEVAEVISAEKRDSDVAARYGGEEFVLLLTHTDSNKAFVFAERLRRKIEKYDFILKEQTITVTISGGIASYPFNSTDPAKLLQMADKAMYLSKGAGKNRISLFREEKRRFLRVDVNQPVKVKKLDFEDSHIFTGTCKDISVGGVKFISNEHIPIGTLLKIQVSLGESKTPLILIGKVVRLEPADNDSFIVGMTTSFKELDSFVSKEIAAIIPDDSFFD